MKLSKRRKNRDRGASSSSASSTASTSTSLKQAREVEVDDFTISLRRRTRNTAANVGGDLKLALDKMKIEPSISTGTESPHKKAKLNTEPASMTDFVDKMKKIRIEPGIYPLVSIIADTCKKIKIEPGVSAKVGPMVRDIKIEPGISSAKDTMPLSKVKIEPGIFSAMDTVPLMKIKIEPGISAMEEPVPLAKIKVEPGISAMEEPVPLAKIKVEPGISSMKDTLPMTLTKINIEPGDSAMRHTSRLTKIKSEPPKPTQPTMVNVKTEPGVVSKMINSELIKARVKTFNLPDDGPRNKPAVFHVDERNRRSLLKMPAKDELFKLPLKMKLKVEPEAATVKTELTKANVKMHFLPNNGPFSLFKKENIEFTIKVEPGGENTSTELTTRSLNKRIPNVKKYSEFVKELKPEKTRKRGQTGCNDADCPIPRGYAPLKLTRLDPNKEIPDNMKEDLKALAIKMDNVKNEVADWDRQIYSLETDIIRSSGPGGNIFKSSDTEDPRASIRRNDTSKLTERIVTLSSVTALRNVPEIAAEYPNLKDDYSNVEACLQKQNRKKQTIKIED